jgi:hypothetical protein
VAEFLNNNCPEREGDGQEGQQFSPRSLDLIWLVFFYGDTSADSPRTECLRMLSNV